MLDTTRQLAVLQADAEKAFAEAKPGSLETLRVHYMGKKGELKRILNEIGSLPAEERKTLGKIANQTRNAMEAALEEARARIAEIERQTLLQAGVLDPSVSRRVPFVGYPHPLSVVLRKMLGIFERMGFSIDEGPELEEEMYNFDYLNFPKDHPAKDDHDSFYIDVHGHLMRTHTSPVQVRIMCQEEPPLAVVVPGRCFRRDAIDATHTHTFHQIEGFVVDKDVNLANMKGTLEQWAHLMFGTETKVRFRPDFFPFTEPSLEMSVSSPGLLGGKWIEIAGCGMVDPDVFRAVGYDPEQHIGYAFGMGVERIAMVNYGIQDIRELYENDMRLLKQFDGYN